MLVPKPEQFWNSKTKQNERPGIEKRNGRFHRILFKQTPAFKKILGQDRRRFNFKQSLSDFETIFKRVVINS